MNDVRVAAVQMEHTAGDKTANFAKMERFARQASERGVQIVAFPECCIVGYWFLRNLTRARLEELAEAVPDGPSTRRLIRLAREYNISIGADLIERAEDGRLFNTYVVAMPDGQVHRHRKIQAFEHDTIAAGSEYCVFDTPYGVRVGVLICYDNNIVENVRITALMGADILLAPHQTGGCNSVSPHGMKPVDKTVWNRRNESPEAMAALTRELTGDKGRGWLMRWLPSRAHDNGVFVVFANGIGVDDDEIRTGNAMILDPYGRVLAETAKADDDMVVSDLDARLLDNCTGRRWIKVRRPDLYAPLTVATGKERDTRLVRFGREA
jgi:N-carbamoylputrescine amidase